MKKEIKIVIADDHEIWRKGMIQVLHTIAGLKVLGEAEDGVELLQQCKRWMPDLVFTDIKMPGMDGMQAIQEILQSNIPPAIIAMSMIEDEMAVYDVLASGAKGYLVKNAKRYEIQQAIEAVMETDRYYCVFENQYLATLIKHYTYPQLPADSKQFTLRELEVMEGIVEQLTSEEIGQRLFISPQTVNGHRNNLLKKTGAKNAIGIILYGIKNRLIKW